MPKIAVSAIAACCWFGMLMPAIRAMFVLVTLERAGP
jgi:hypothetical protein